MNHPWQSIESPGPAVKNEPQDSEENFLRSPTAASFDPGTHRGGGYYPPTSDPRSPAYHPGFFGEYSVTPTPTTPGAASRYGVDELESVRAAHAEYPPLDVARLNEDARSQVLLGEFKDALASSRQTDAEYRDMVLQAHTNYTYMWQTRFNMAGSLYVQSTETDAVKNMKYGHYASTQYSAAMRHFHDDQNAKHFQLFGIPMAISGPGHPISQVSATLINCRTTHFALWLQTIIELRKASVQVLPAERICSSLRDIAHRSDLTRLVTNCKNAKRQVDSLIKDQASLTVVINEWRKEYCGQLAAIQWSGLTGATYVPAYKITTAAPSAQEQQVKGHDTAPENMKPPHNDVVMHAGKWYRQWRYQGGTAHHDPVRYNTQKEVWQRASKTAAGTYRWGPFA